MKSKLKFLIPNKKTALLFVILSVVMGLATLQGGNFSESKPSVLYEMLSWATGPAWEMWLYVSAPALYFFGVMPQSGIRWYYFESRGLVYGLNFAYYYFASSVVAYLWNAAGRYVYRIKNE